MYITEYYLAIEKNEIMPFTATWIDLEMMLILSEVNQTEKDKHQMISLICRIFKNDSNELIKKQKQMHRLREQTHGYQW